MEHAQDASVVLLDASDMKDDTYVEKTGQGAVCLPYRGLRDSSGLMKGVTFGMEREAYDEAPFEELFKSAGVNEESLVGCPSQSPFPGQKDVFYTRWDPGYSHELALHGGLDGRGHV